MHIPAGTCPPPVAMKQTFENACLFLQKRERERERTFLKFNPNRFIEISCTGFPSPDPPPISFRDEIFTEADRLIKTRLFGGVDYAKKKKKRKIENRGNGRTK